MINHIRRSVYLYVFTGFFLAIAGSYEDFFIAIKRDDPGTIRQLVLRGFDANIRSPEGQHGLFLALRDGSLKAARELLAVPKIDVEARNQADESPLMMAALKGHIDIARQLIDLDADVNKTGWAPLHYAATNGHVELMRLLLDNHAYIDAESPNGTTPLMMAAHYGSPQAVKVLLEAGADPTLKNALGLSAIDFAQRAGRAESAELIAAFIRGRQPRGTW